MHAIRSILALLARLPIWIACAALFALMVMTFCDVILRSSFNAPIEAATELTRILVAVVVFAVMPHVSVGDGHIAVDLTDGVFERMRLTRARNGLVPLVSAILLYWPIMQVWKLTERTRGYGDVTQYLGIPQYLVMWFIGASLSVAAAAMFVTGLLTLVAPRFLEELKS